ncbi:MAG: extracellular solute-binding protein [Firmicutes bacterium]|nr:extracellular solute-binding protein [Bacillota bacterium]
MKGKSLLKRIIALALVLLIVLALAACSNSKKGGDTQEDRTAADNQKDNTGEIKSGKLFDKPTKISIVMGSHASWPYDPNWAMWKIVSEATNIEFDIQAIPNTEMETKVNLIMASRDQLPDLLHLISKAIADKHALAGAFVSIMDNLDKLPNFSNWIKNTPDSKECLAQRTSGDGKIYFFPTYGLHTINNLRAWMYRKDIFEKHGLTPPKDVNEMYQVAKKLKELYPDSYPLAFRTGLGQLEIMAPQWKPYHALYGYYDFNTKKWGYGAIEDTTKEMVMFFKKMADEELLPPDFLTIETKSWQELVSSGRGFMMPEYIVRIDFFNGPARVTDPEYTWAVMAPPKGIGPNATDRIKKTNFEFSGFLVCNTGKQENINNAFKYVDWMYSPEGIEILSWGKEGVTYKVVNGEKQFILDDKGTPPRNLYGVGTYGLYQVIDPASNEALYSKENVEQARIAIQYVEERANPLNWLPFNEQETEMNAQLGTTIATYVNEQLSKFLLGQRPLSEWDAYVQEVKKLGVDKLIKMYEEAYNRVAKE